MRASGNPLSFDLTFLARAASLFMSVMRFLATAPHRDGWPEAAAMPANTGLLLTPNGMQGDPADSRRKTPNPKY
jgi:hypothetical protein